jgi:hypothetical protein
VLARADEHDGHRHVRLRQTSGAETDEGAELLEAIFLPAVFEQRRVLAEVPRHDVARQSHHALDGRERQRIDLFRDAHDERLADGEGERQPDREARARARRRLDEKSAAELLDLGRDHVHAHAAARRLRDAARGAEPRLEDELHCLLVGELRVAVGETQCHGLLANQLDVDAGAVVGHHDDHLGAVARQADRDAAHVRFAERRAALGRLDAMHDRVAQHVLERRHHALEHLTIELGRGPLHDELRPLAGVVGRLTHEPGEPLHVALEGNHARAHQAVLQLGDGASLLGQEVLRLPRERLQQSLDAGDVARGLGRARASIAGSRSSGRARGGRSRRGEDPPPPDAG